MHDAINTQDEINMQVTSILEKVTGALDLAASAMRLLEAKLADLEAKLTLCSRMTKQHDEDLYDIDGNYVKLAARVHELEQRAGAEKAARNG